MPETKRILKASRIKRQFRMNKVLKYSSGSYIRYPVKNHNAKEYFKKKNAYMYITGSGLPKNWILQLKKRQFKCKKLGIRREIHFTATLKEQSRVIPSKFSGKITFSLEFYTQPESSIRVD